MKGANSNRRRDHRTITVDRWDAEGDLNGLHLVAIYRGDPEGAPEYCEIIDSQVTAFAYARSMARHLRCPIHDLTGSAS